MMGLSVADGKKRIWLGLALATEAIYVGTILGIGAYNSILIFNHLTAGDSIAEVAESPKEWVTKNLSFAAIGSLYWLWKAFHKYFPSEKS